jgi:ribosomal protein S18 acetylase RimI-like enzyme
VALSVNTTRHPAHAELVQAVWDWFHQPFQEMGYRAEKRRWGTYWSTGDVYVKDLPPEQVDAFLVDARRYYEDRRIVIHVDDRALDVRLGPALRDAGWTKGRIDVFLAHVGPVPPLPPIPSLEVEPVTESNLRQFVMTKLQAFAECESEVEDAAVAAEMAQRRAEVGGTVGGLLARLAGRPAGIIWWYEEGPDVWVMLLGTRPAFRNRGIGSWLLSSRLEAAYQRGFRSVVLNVMMENQRAIGLYRRLGFQDQVAWRQRYVEERP